MYQKEYLVVTLAGASLDLEESFTNREDALNLLASGTGNYVITGYATI